MTVTAFGSGLSESGLSLSRPWPDPKQVAEYRQLKRTFPLSCYYPFPCNSTILISAMTEENPWKTLSTRIVYQNPWITVREDQVVRPDGNPGIYGVVETRIATGVVALSPQNEVYLVGQYRYPTGVYSWEIIEGGADGNEEPLDAIKRELKEEAGLSAGNWECLGDEFHLSNCFSAERARLFLARDLVEGRSEPEATEILKVRKVPFAEPNAVTVMYGPAVDFALLSGVSSS